LLRGGEQEEEKEEEEEEDEDLSNIESSSFKL
jgi:hypothetical protein